MDFSININKEISGKRRASKARFEDRRHSNQIKLTKPGKFPNVINVNISLPLGGRIDRRPTKSSTSKTTTSRQKLVRLSKTQNAQNLKQSDPKGQPRLLPGKEKKEICRREIVMGDKLGEGVAGEVFKGEWNDQAVAIKKFKATSARETILAEVHNATSVNHPNVVKSHGVVDEGEEILLVMDLMHCSLHNLLHPGRSDPVITLTRQNIVCIAMDIAEGLKYLHSQSPKIIHRDLKTANILLDKNYRAKLSDFGTARFLDQNSLANTVTGTPCYMAPEVLGEEPYDEKADIYSFAAVLYEMTTQLHLPIYEEKRKTKIEQNVQDEALQALIISCCRTDPKERPDINQCIDELKKLL